MSDSLRQSVLDRFEKIYVINLAHRADRRTEIDAQLGLFGLSLSHPDVILFDAVRPEDKGEWDSIGARGCFMSHLGILRDAQAQGWERLLILEDDLDWTRSFLSDAQGVLDDIGACAWDFMHGGMTAAADRPALRPVSPEEGLRLTHFIAVSGGIVPRLVAYLEAMAARKSGDPRGGPMHVDGAYSWFRMDNPDVTAFVAVPALGHQRRSRTDIHDLKWFDRMPVISSVANLLRRLRPRRG